MLFIYMCSKKYLTLPYSDVVISVSVIVVITVMGSFFYAESVKKRLFSNKLDMEKQGLVLEQEINPCQHLMWLLQT